MARGGGGTWPGSAKPGQGRRSLVRNGMKDAAKTAPEQFKAFFLPRAEELFGIVWEDARDRECVGHRTAIGAILAGLEIAGPGEAFWQKMLDSLGARDRNDFERTYARGRLAEGADLELSCERAKDLLRRRMASDHGYRRELLWELFGMREVAHESHTNGVTNGVASHD